MIKAEEFLQQAEVLIQEPSTSEVNIRSSISRAYYSAYHSAHEFHNELSSPGETPPKNYSIHQELIYRLTTPTIKSDTTQYKNSKKIGYMLKTLKDRRVQADYHLQLGITCDIAQLQLIESQKLIQLTQLTSI